MVSSQRVIHYLKNYHGDGSLSNSSTLKKISQPTIIEEQEVDGIVINKYINEFWTSRQRQASSIHEISYRACFKPQLPRFFINLLSEPKDIVYDPFSGRGTTVIEASLLLRNIISNDINPLSEILTYPRFFIPKLTDIRKRLDSISILDTAKADIDLSMFYHPRTEAEIVSLKTYLMSRREAGEEDNLDKWINSNLKEEKPIETYLFPLK